VRTRGSLLAKGIDPSATRKAEAAAQTQATTETFKAIAQEWLLAQAKRVKQNTLGKDRHRLERFLYPHLGDRPIAAITSPELLAELRKIEAKGHYETASRSKEVAGRVFRFALSTGRLTHDPSQGLTGALVAPNHKSYASLTDPVKVGQLLRDIDGYEGHPVTAAALRLAPLVFVRPGELRYAEWSEIDLEAGEWRIPAEKMKMKDSHFVPLATQAVEILRALKPLTGEGERAKYVFPSIRSRVRPMSENTVNAALRRMDYTNEQHTGHGFRSMASTLLNEQGWHPDLIELQLAHAERNQVRAAYNKAQRLEDRKKMMQAWADYLDRLRNPPSNVTEFRKQA
jgi:integrase